MLDETIPETTVRIHASDKPWMSAYIKKEIKARQKAYTSGNTTKYRRLADKISKLIKKAKSEYYKSKVEGLRKHDSVKWHKSIFQLAGSNGENSTNNLSPDRAANTVELLQNAFTKPWQNLPESTLPSLNDVAPFLRSESPQIPTIGQV